MTAGWLNHPVGGLDTETTGTDVESARIVTAAVHFTGDGTVRRTISWLINPGVPIPAEATAVHGVTDEMAADGESPLTAVARIERSLQWLWDHDVPVIGHNIVFDLTILDRELRRHLGRPLEISGPVIDTLCIDRAVDPFRPKKVASHALGDACRHWGVHANGEKLHTSAGDVTLAVRLAQQILGVSRFADGKLCHAAVALQGLSLQELWFRQVQWYADQSASNYAYRDREGLPVDDRNTVWPVKPYNEKVE